jgi:DNA-binding NarL/FixJ family response regulator
VTDVDFTTIQFLIQPRESVTTKLRKQLSDRECEILKLFAVGYSRQQVANACNTTDGNVDRILESIRHKLFEHQVRIGGSMEYSYVHFAHLAIAIKLIEVLSIEMSE